MAEKRRTKAAPKTKAAAPGRERKDDFLTAFEALLRKRKLKVPAGLSAAPPEAYARQPASVVDQLGSLDDTTLVAQAERIAGYAKRLAARAAQEWERSPLIAELRRRKLEEPPVPRRVVGAVVSMKKPLAQWTDVELMQAASEWSARGRVATAERAARSKRER